MAKAAGVSHGTASNVFSRPEIVRPEMRERVLAAAQKLGYGGPDPKGRLLRAGKVNAIGVATGEPLAYFFDDPFARVVMSGISHACDATGAGISLVSAINPEQLAWNVQSALVDGFIVFCLGGGSQLVELVRERKLPFVALDYGFDDPNIASIGIDDQAGARMAAQPSRRSRPSPLRGAGAVLRGRPHRPGNARRWRRPRSMPAPATGLPVMPRHLPDSVSISRTSASTRRSTTRRR